MLHTLLVIIHILICIVLTTVVLLQSSKGGGLAGAFGGAGGAPQQLLGSRGMTTLLHKLTIYCAVAFFVSSLLLFLYDPSAARTSSRSVVNEAAEKGELSVPITENPLATPGEEAPAQTPAGGNDDADSGEGGGN